MHLIAYVDFKTYVCSKKFLDDSYQFLKCLTTKSKQHVALTFFAYAKIFKG